MRIGITGHTNGLGKAIYDRWSTDAVGFSRSNGYDIEDPECRRRIVEESSDLEVFINCAHSGMGQVYLLNELSSSWSRTDRLIINISSNSSDGIKNFRHIYAIEKSALDKASEQISLLPDSCRIANLKPGYIDVERISGLGKVPKIDLDRMVSVIDMLISQPHLSNIHSLTILPRREHPEWYYSDLVFPYFDDRMCDRIREVATRVIADSAHVGYEYSEFDHLRFHDIMPDIPELSALIEDCTVGARADIFFLPPNVVMPVHADTKDYGNIRASTIAISMLPEDDVPETNWYWGKSSPPCATARWGRNDAKLLNISKLHGGIRTDGRWRANLQISLTVGYEDALAMIRKGTLFRTNRVMLRDGN